MLRGAYLHPNGQIPAYEWNFSDVNPPVHAFATLFLHRTEQALRGEVDLDFLKATFNKLLLNFTWWVNRKDRFGKNVFEGGFLGLDNIGVFDRSAPLPTGGHLEQADGTAWMALFSQNMLELAVELAAHDPTYEDMVVKFVEHFFYIAAGMNRAGRGRHVGRGGRLLLRRAAAARRQRHAAQGPLDGRAAPAVRHDGDRAVAARARPAGDGRASRNACAGCPNWRRRCTRRARALRRGRAGTAGAGQPGPAPPDPVEDARRERVPEPVRHPRALAVPRATTRTSSTCGGQEHRVDYLPAESNTGMFGGNSNWRGPIWMPVNVILIRALLHYYTYYGDNFKIECPTGSGQHDESLRGRQGDRRPPHAASSCATSTGAGRSTAARRRSRRIRTGATTSCSTSISTATTARASAPATRRDGRASSRR